MIKIIKDIATLADGESTCLVGVLALIGVCAIMIYLLFGLWASGIDIDKIIKVFSSFFQWLIMLMGGGGLGKLATNKAEPT